MAVSCRLSVLIMVILGTSIHKSNACRFAELLQGHRIEGGLPHPLSEHAATSFSFQPLLE
jgi:hypothetical protein